MRLNLIDVYIYEVTRRLPEKSREDIGLELRSTIEDMLPEDHGEEDVKMVLAELGNPAVLASGYHERPMHLIGPKYFHIYVSLLKMIAPIAMVITIISITAKYMIGFEEGDTVLNIGLIVLGEGIWGIVNVFMQVFFWLTLTFAIIERADNSKDEQPRTMSFTKWTPDDLKAIPYEPKRKISKGFVFGSLLWTAIWATVYFYADHLAGVYENSGEGLEFIMPALNQDVLNSYWPLVLIVVGLEITLVLYLYIRSYWTKKAALFNVIKEAVSMIVLIIIMTNSQLFNIEFLTYMRDKVDFSPEQMKRFIIGIIVILFPIFSLWNCIDGFRKAKQIK